MVAVVVHSSLVNHSLIHLAGMAGTCSANEIWRAEDDRRVNKIIIIIPY